MKNWKNKAWDSISALESRTEDFVRRATGFFALGLTGVVMASFPLPYLALAEEQKPTLWWQNKTNLEIPSVVFGRVKKEMEFLGFPNKEVFSQGTMGLDRFGQVQIDFVNKKDLGYEETKGLPWNARGFAKHHEQKIYIFLDQVLQLEKPETFLAHLMIHEVGHALGELEHTEELDNFMYPYLDPNPLVELYWTPKQVEQLQNAWTLP